VFSRWTLLTERASLAYPTQHTHARARARIRTQEQDISRCIVKRANKPNSSQTSETQTKWEVERAVLDVGGQREENEKGGGGGGSGFEVVKPCRERHNECNAEICRLEPGTDARERKTEKERERENKR